MDQRQHDRGALATALGVARHPGIAAAAYLRPSSTFPCQLFSFLIWSTSSDHPSFCSHRPPSRATYPQARAQLVDLALQIEVLALELMDFGLQLSDAGAQPGDFVGLA